VPDVIRRLTAEHAYQIKFVVDEPRDLVEVDQYLEEFPEIDRDCVMLMPQGTDAATLQRTQTWLEPYCRQHGLRFCSRKHVEWFGLVRGT
jgi:7-carboxy-7-deazaguanine synthase